MQIPFARCFDRKLALIWPCLSPRLSLMCYIYACKLVVKCAFKFNWYGWVPPTPLPTATHKHILAALGTSCLSFVRICLPADFHFVPIPDPHLHPLWICLNLAWVIQDLPLIFKCNRSWNGQIMYYLFLKAVGVQWFQLLNKYVYLAYIILIKNVLIQCLNTRFASRFLYAACKIRNF